MRILHVNKFLYRRGGAEGYMEDVATLQVAAGHDVAFFGMRHPDNIDTAYNKHFPPYIELEPPSPSLTGKLRGVARILWSTSARRGINEVIEAFQPDVAHLHNIYHQLSPSILGPLARHGVPTVMTLHDYKLACPTYLFMADGRPCEACLGGKFHNAVRKRCKDGSLSASAVSALELAVHTAAGVYDPVKVFICPSRFMKEKMTAAGVYPERLRQVSHFVDAAGIALKSGPGGGIVVAGRLSTEKGVDVLVEAVGRLDGDVVLDVAGEGPERLSLEALARERAPGQVRFWGRLPKPELFSLLRQSAVLSLPSRCYENQPVTILEAFASGVPVVGSDLGGIPELIETGVHGQVVPADDADALANALRSVLAEPERAFAMGRAARRFVEDEFSCEKHLARLDALYDEAGCTSVKPAV